MNSIRCLLTTVVTGLIASHAYAQQIPLNDLDEAGFQDVVKELSADLQHTSVAGASSLGDVFGIELGIVGGVTRTPKINAIVQEVDPDSKAEQLYHGEILGQISVPLGFTVEAGLIPKVGSKDFKFNSFSIGGKWTATDALLDWPLSLAVKAYLTKAHLEFGTSSGGGTTNYTYDNSIFAAALMVSKNFAIVEPYFGIGTASATGGLSATGTYSSTLFNYTANDSASAKASGMGWMVGAEFKLIILKLGVEYSKFFDTSRYSGKVAFYF